MLRRLQLGAGEFTNLDLNAARCFLDSTWTNLGAAEGRPRPFVTRVHLAFSQGPQHFWFLAKHKLRSALTAKKRSQLRNDANIQPFWFEKGGRLPFADGEFTFIYSEHFFEHLFLDEAIDLLKECRRVLRPKGIIRTCVPDSDLQVYAKPERVGFPSTAFSFTDPEKHKTRWSVYSLTAILELLEFTPVPLVYCDRQGNYMCAPPNPANYEDCADEAAALSTDYISRYTTSLVVDGVKSAADESSQLTSADHRLSPVVL